MAQTRIYKVLFVAAMLSACASKDPYEDLPPLDLEAVKQSMNCPIGTAATCEEHMGQTARCYCADRETLRRMLEPDT
jgi:hypothetical protein